MQPSKNLLFKVFQEDPSGLQVFEWLYNTYLLKASHVPGDPYSTAFHEGQRDVIRTIILLMTEGEENG